MLKEGISGIRGYEAELSSGLITKYIKAFFKLVNPKKVVVGRDSRKSGERIVENINKALRSFGVTVLDIGINPTPTVQVTTEKMGYDAGIIVTASHNPLPWNGLKFVDASGTFFNREKMSKLLEIKEDMDDSLPDAFKEGRVIYNPEIADEHKKMVKNLKIVDRELISRRGFRVVVDAVNGACSKLLPDLLEELGCEVVKINCDFSKPFSRTPEPLPENLEDLERSVKEEKADIGFAVDPDGDRLAIVSDEGKAIGEEYTVVFAIDLVLSRLAKGKKKVVVNLSTTKLVDDVAERYGAEVIRAPVGEINVVDKMRETGAVIGGEGNGGVIYPEAHYGRDSLVGAVLTLQLLAERNISVGQYVNSMPKYVMLKQRVDSAGVDLDRVISKIIDDLTPEHVDSRDGFKLSWSNRWVHIRPSNTEPIVRIYSEAKERSIAQQLIDRVKTFLS